jgi:hypothetical protein
VVVHKDKTIPIVMATSSQIVGLSDCSLGFFRKEIHIKEAGLIKAALPEN